MTGSRSDEAPNGAGPNLAIGDHEGYAVIEARNADEAIATIRSREIDAVISDVRMPGRRDGVGLALWLARNAPSITVVIVSGRRRPDALKRFLPRTPFFQKPFRVQDVLAELGNRLGRTH